MGQEALDRLLIPGTGEEIAARYRTLAKRAADARFGLDEAEVVILDTETTGLDTDHDRLIEISAAIMKGPDVVDRFETLVNPCRRIPAEIVALTGITDEMVSDAPVAEDALCDFAVFCSGRMMVAHNAPFDRAFIMREAQRGDFDGAWIDTVELARIALPRLTTHALDALAEAFGTSQPTHRAGADVEALCTVWRVLLVALSDLPAGLLEFIAGLWPDIPWPARSVLSYIAAANPAGRFGLFGARNDMVRADRADSKDDAADRGLLFPDHMTIEHAFEPGSTVPRMYPGYEPRNEQVQMAEEVADAFGECTHRAIEAGTGVGKSIAYLLPAALSAKHNNISIGVATKTNALMDQLVYHELPALAAELDGGLRYAALKGYEHYPCLRKMERMAAEEPESCRGAELARVRADLSMLATLYSFVAQTAFGDLDAVSIYWRGLSRERVCATSGECVHNHCRFFPTLCMLHGLRQRAKSADIVVTNHALLFRDVIVDGSILPPIRHWIIDEAHAVEQEARRQLSPTIELPEVTRTFEALYRGQASALSNIVRKMTRGVGFDASGVAPVLAACGKVRAQAEQTSTAADSFFSYVKDLQGLAEKSSYDSVDLWISPAVRQSAQWAQVERTGVVLVGHLERLVQLCTDTLELLEASSADLADIRSELSTICGYLRDMREALALCVSCEDDGYAYSARLNRNIDTRTERLAADIIDVGDTLAHEFYPRMMSVVYTSATIAVGDSFEHFAHAVGLDRLDPGTWSTLQLASSYDFDRNMTVFVPTDMPAPRTAGHPEALVSVLYDVHMTMGGSTLTLFTNRREMERAYLELEPLLAREGLTLLCQRRGMSARRLRAEFVNDKHASLFALRSFWEGFDAPGDTLRCVVIPKLPFGRPSDPLARERDARESNTWRRYALPEAVLDLKQAAGRLIRTSTDWGFLVLADARLVTKSYGKVFLDALPSGNIVRLPLSELPAQIRKRLQ